MASGENDGFSQLIAAIDFQTVFHQIIQHGINGSQIDDIPTFHLIAIQNGSVQFRGIFTAPAQECIFNGLLFFLAEFIISNAPAHGFRGFVQYGKSNQIPVGNGFFQLVGIVRLTVGEFKHLIGTFVVFHPGRCGQTNHQGIEIVEQSAVLSENGAVGLVNDNQIESANAKLSGVVVDQIDHGLVGRENNTGIGIPVHTAAGIDRSGHTGQQFSEILVGLTNQRSPVRKEQDILHPTSLHQHIRQGNGHTGFAGAGGHDQQGVTAILHECVAGGGDGFFLIGTTGDGFIDLRRRNILPGSGTEFQQLQLLKRMELENPAGLVSQLVNDVDVVAVGVVNNRLVPIFHCHFVGFFYGLGTTSHQILGGDGVLDDGQGAVVPAVEHIVHGVFGVEDDV